MDRIARPAATAGVQIVTTGGTFDKVYDPITESMRLTGASSVPGILRACGGEGIRVDPIFSIDSLDMTDAARGDLVAHVRGMARVVVVHGTGSIVDTARFFLDAQVTGVVVFTGAMTPFSCDPVEASFNLGGAVALAATMDPGVYIYMHGEVFDPRRTHKDTAIARLVHSDAR